MLAQRGKQYSALADTMVCSKSGEPRIAVEPFCGMFDSPSAGRNLEAAVEIGSLGDLDGVFVGPPPASLSLSPA